ncbi:hypothetical protein JHK86_003169 [Glycine max]|nr:hypothetical protein JHK86_003169 [Glycine max]
MVKGRQSRLGHRKPSRGSSWPVMLTLLATCSFLILILLALPILSNSNANSSGRLIIKPNDLNSIALNTTTHISEAEYDQLGERWVEIISWEPRIFLYHNFLVSFNSFSFNGYPPENPILIMVEYNGEELQVLHYQVGEKYVPHHDYFMDDINTANGGDRIATMLMYLSDVEEGGETVFPDAKGNFSSMPGWNELSAEPTEQKAIIKSLSFSLSFNNTNGESQTVFSAVASQIMVAGFVSGHAHSAAADLLLPHSHSSSSPHSLHSPCQCQLLRFSQHSHVSYLYSASFCYISFTLSLFYAYAAKLKKTTSMRLTFCEFCGVEDLKLSLCFIILLDIPCGFLENGEPIYVIHYEVGQYYDPHYDYFIDDFNIENGGQRIATMLMYLSNVEEGGETMFPRAKANFSSVPWWNELSNCGKMGLSIKPKMGDALLFWSMKPNATLDALTLHS